MVVVVVFHRRRCREHSTLWWFTAAGRHDALQGRRDVLGMDHPTEARRIGEWRRWKEPLKMHLLFMSIGLKVEMVTMPDLSMVGEAS